MEICKIKKRGENWIQEDKKLLQDLIRENINIIENKNTDTNTNQLKLNAWKDIAESYNYLAVIPRGVAQLKCQWNIMKMAAKKEHSARKREASPPDPLEEELEESCAYKEEHVDEKEPEICIMTFDAIEAAQTPQIKMAKKRRKDSYAEISEPTASSSGKAVAEHEMKCRAELHELQIQVEKQKLENLSLEREILLQQLKYEKKKNQDV